jgi:hypothetical protein
MAEIERDAEVSRRYRELGAEEPTRVLDEAILAASRRRSSLRWAGPVALAAVLVLGVAVTLQVEREKPDADFQVAQPSAAPAAAPATVAEAPAKVGKVPAKPVESRAAQKPAAPVFAPDPPQPQPQITAPALEPRVEARSRLAERADRQATAAPSAAMRHPGANAGSTADSPERELDRIAVLRRQEKHEEADKALAEFRKRHPDYRLTEEVRARVERR